MPPKRPQGLPQRPPRPADGAELPGASDPSSAADRSPASAVFDVVFTNPWRKRDMLSGAAPLPEAPTSATGDAPANPNETHAQRLLRTQSEFRKYVSRMRAVDKSYVTSDENMMTIARALMASGSAAITTASPSGRGADKVEEVTKSSVQVGIDDLLDVLDSADRAENGRDVEREWRTNASATAASSGGPKPKPSEDDLVTFLAGFNTTADRDKKILSAAQRSEVHLKIQEKRLLLKRLAVDDEMRAIRSTVAPCEGLTNGRYVVRFTHPNWLDFAAKEYLQKRARWRQDSGDRYQSFLFAGALFCVFVAVLWSTWPVWNLLLDLETDEHYHVLGLAQGATEKEVKTAYRKMIRENHPDKNPGCGQRCVDKVYQIQQAHDVLLAKGSSESRSELQRQYHDAIAQLLALVFYRGFGMAMRFTTALQFFLLKGIAVVERVVFRHKFTVPGKYWLHWVLRVGVLAAFVVLTLTFLTEVGWFLLLISTVKVSMQFKEDNAVAQELAGTGRDGRKRVMKDGGNAALVRALTLSNYDLPLNIVVFVLLPALAHTAHFFFFEKYPRLDLFLFQLAFGVVFVTAHLIEYPPNLFDSMRSMECTIPRHFFAVVRPPPGVHSKPSFKVTFSAVAWCVLGVLADDVFAFGTKIPGVFRAVCFFTFGAVMVQSFVLPWAAPIMPEIERNVRKCKQAMRLARRQKRKESELEAQIQESSAATAELKQRALRDDPSRVGSNIDASMLASWGIVDRLAAEDYDAEDSDGEEMFAESGNSGRRSTNSSDSSDKRSFLSRLFGAAPTSTKSNQDDESASDSDSTSGASDTAFDGHARAAAARKVRRARREARQRRAAGDTARPTNADAGDVSARPMRRRHKNKQRPATAEEKHELLAGLDVESLQWIDQLVVHYGNSREPTDRRTKAIWSFDAALFNLSVLGAQLAQGRQQLAQCETQAQQVEMEKRLAVVENDIASQEQLLANQRAERASAAADTPSALLSLGRLQPASCYGEHHAQMTRAAIVRTAFQDMAGMLSPLRILFGIRLPLPGIFTKADNASPNADQTARELRPLGWAALLLMVLYIGAHAVDVESLVGKDAPETTATGSASASSATKSRLPKGAVLKAWRDPRQNPAVSPYQAQATTLSASRHGPVPKSVGNAFTKLAKMRQSHAKHRQQQQAMGLSEEELQEIDGRFEAHMAEATQRSLHISVPAAGGGVALAPENVLLAERAQYPTAIDRRERQLRSAKAYEQRQQEQQRRQEEEAQRRAKFDDQRQRRQRQEQQRKSKKQKKQNRNK